MESARIGQPLVYCVTVGAVRGIVYTPTDVGISIERGTCEKRVDRGVRGLGDRRVDFKETN